MDIVFGDLPVSIHFVIASAMCNIVTGSKSYGGLQLAQ